GIFNPKRFGYLILLLACLEFFSYVFAKILGQKKGLLFVGFLGGFVSSTNVLLSSARLSVKNPEAWRLHLSSALAAKLASFAELLLIILWIAPKLFISIIWAVGAAIGIGALQLRFFAKQRLGSKADFQMKSPLDWKGVIRLSLLFSLIIAGISAAKMWMGDKASAAVSFMTALFELQGVSLANATMFIHDQLELKSAAFNVLLAVNASLISKIAISWIVARG